MPRLAKSNFTPPLADKDADKLAAAKATSRTNCTLAANDIVRWYLMVYPYGRKGLTLGLEREMRRRSSNAETAIEFFAPKYVEARKIDGRVQRTEKQLFFNYVFVRASVRELFRLKQFEAQYNFARRDFDSKGGYTYPFVTDEMMQTLKWIARSYQGVIPVCTDDSFRLIKGDRIRITAGSFKGIEARLFDDRKDGSKEIMVVVDGWMSIPLLHVKESQYKLIALSDGTSEQDDIKIADELLPTLHDILCRKLSNTISSSDEDFASRVLCQFADKQANSDIQRCKLSSILLTAHTILDNFDHRDRIISGIEEVLPVITAEQSKALLLTMMYGCTDNSRYYVQAHALVDPWKSEPSLKKSKQQLISRLADYDRLLGHLIQIDYA